MVISKSNKSGKRNQETKTTEWPQDNKLSKSEN